MNYREFRPSDPLATLVDCIWTLEGRAQDLLSDLQPVLPDGRPELILHFGDPFERVDQGRATVRQAAIIFAGQLTSQLTLRPTGRVSVLGVRFRPDGAAPLVTMPQYELAGLTAWVGDISPRFWRELDEVRERCTTLADAARAVQTLLLRRAVRLNPDPQVRHVVDTIQRRRGRVSVDGLATEAGLSRRHLERRFIDRVGVSPKRLARIARFQHALRLLEEADPASRGTIAAAECGFADQAHFIRDFRDLAGCAPGEHLLRKAELTGFFLGRSPARQA